MLYSQIILAISKTVGVPGALLLAICTHESNLTNVTVLHDNGSPSYGLCQIKKQTAQGLGFKGPVSGELVPSTKMKGTLQSKGKDIGLMDPSTNAKYAALYLKMQLDRYNGDWCKATAAYNSGTYNPSKKSPGKPKNFKYVKKVVLHLDGEHKDFLVCGPRKIEVYEDNEP